MHMRSSHSSQRQTRKSKRTFSSHREGVMGVGEKRAAFQQPGLLTQPSLNVADGLSPYPQHAPPMLADSATQINAGLGGGLPSTPTMGYNHYTTSNSYHAPASVPSGTPTTPSTPMGSLALHGLGHGVGPGTLLRPTTATLHTPSLQHFGNHPLNGGLGGLHQTYPSAPNPQQPSALVQSPIGDRGASASIHTGISVSTPTSHGLSTQSNGHAGRSGLGGPANLSASVPHGVGRPPPPPAPIPPIPIPALPCATMTTPTNLEAGTPTSGPPPSLPILSGPSPLHGASQHLVQLPPANYSQDRVPFDLDYPPHGLYFRCLLDAKLVGGLIGKKGQTIEHIRKHSNAKIHIAKKLPNQQPIMRLVTVSGQCKQVVEALQMIADKLASAEQDAMATSGSGEPSHGVTLLVDEKNVGCLIGKNGNTINGIRKKTGANVFISSHLMPNSTEKCIDLSGSKVSVDEALEAICQQFISNPKFVHTRNEYNPQASLFAASAYMYPATMQLFGTHPLARSELADSGSPIGFPCSPNGQTMTVQYLVEKSHIGGIIGRGGRNIAEIRRQSQANVTIDNDQSNDHRTVTLRGTRQEIMLALSLLQHAIAINHPPRETRG